MFRDSKIVIITNFVVVSSFGTCKQSHIQKITGVGVSISKVTNASLDELQQVHDVPIKINCKYFVIQFSLPNVAMGS